MEGFHRKIMQERSSKNNRKLIEEIMSSIEMLEQPFSERIEELLRSRKVIVACDALVKNVVMGVH